LADCRVLRTTIDIGRASRASGRVIGYIIADKTRAGLYSQIPGFSKACCILLSVNAVCHALQNKGKKYLFFINKIPRLLFNRVLSLFEYTVDSKLKRIISRSCSWYIKYSRKTKSIIFKF
jgi:hypothetical protein